MKQALRLAVAVLCVTLVSLATAVAQDQYTEGPVDRVVLVHILPGHFNAFMDDVKNNIKPIWDAEKKRRDHRRLWHFPEPDESPASTTGTLASSSPTRTWPLSMDWG